MRQAHAVIWPEIIERLECGKQVGLGHVGDAINARLVADGHNLCLALTTPALLRALILAAIAASAKPDTSPRLRSRAASMA